MRWPRCEDPHRSERKLLIVFNIKEKRKKNNFIFYQKGDSLDFTFLYGLLSHKNRWIQVRVSDIKVVDSRLRPDICNCQSHVKTNNETLPSSVTILRPIPICIFKTLNFDTDNETLFLRSPNRDQDWDWDWHWDWDSPFLKMYICTWHWLWPLE